LKNDTVIESLWLFFISKLQNFLIAPRISSPLCTSDLRAKFYGDRERMAKVHSGEEILPKASSP